VRINSNFWKKYANIVKKNVNGHLGHRIRVDLGENFFAVDHYLEQEISHT